MLEVAAFTDVGARRQINEDHFVVNEEHHLFVVCDGMGGHAGGEAASRLATENIHGFVVHTRLGPVPQLPWAADPALPPEANRLSMAIRWANSTIHAASAANAALKGMGTTVVAMLVHEGTAFIAHVGDSRAYRLRQDRLEQLTRDDSELNALIDAGRLRPEDAYHHPDKNFITKALGVTVDAVPTMRMERVRDGDLYLLCTDGLSDLVSDRVLRESMQQALETRDRHGNVRLQWLGTELVRLANRGGGKDNITAVLVYSR